MKYIIKSMLCVDENGKPIIVYDVEMYHRWFAEMPRSFRTFKEAKHFVELYKNHHNKIVWESN